MSGAVSVFGVHAHIFYTKASAHVCKHVKDIAALQTVRDKCFAKCITAPGRSLSSGEQTCLQRCVDRYGEVRLPRLRHRACSACERGFPQASCPVGAGVRSRPRSFAWRCPFQGSMRHHVILSLAVGYDVDGQRVQVTELVTQAILEEGMGS